MTAIPKSEISGGEVAELFLGLQPDHGFGLTKLIKHSWNKMNSIFQEFSDPSNILASNSFRIYVNELKWHMILLLKNSP
jgi:hypothetical protein